MPLTFDEADFGDIQTALNDGGRIWYNPVLNRLKRKIKDYYISDDTSKCCYCCKLFHGEFRMVIDIEHVLPQRHYESERFKIENLNVACKRCNMDIKNDDLTFLNNTIVANDYYNSNHYKIIHPNLDIYSDHLVLNTFRRGDLILNKYVIRTQDKGLFTYEYFELKKLEINTINKAQGLKESQNLNSRFRGILRANLLRLLTRV